jgi:hypothetical protein
MEALLPRQDNEFVARVVGMLERAETSLMHVTPFVPERVRLIQNHVFYLYQVRNLLDIHLGFILIIHTYTLRARESCFLGSYCYYISRIHE